MKRTRTETYEIEAETLNNQAKSQDGKSCAELECLKPKVVNSNTSNAFILVLRFTPTLLNSQVDEQ